MLKDLFQIYKKPAFLSIRFNATLIIKLYMKSTKEETGGGREDK